MPHHSRADKVIARWREVERQLVSTPPGTAIHESLRVEAANLRDEYQELLRAAQDVEGHSLDSPDDPRPRLR